MDTSARKMVGIYGGSFDPIHYGHLRTALEVQEIFGLEQLRLIPCYQSPLKQTPQATALQRVAMVQLAIKNQATLCCDAREIRREKPSYTVETLASLRSELPDCALLLFIGSDAFNQLPNWYCWQQLFDYAHIVVMTRPAVQNNALTDFFATRLVKTVESLKTENAGKLFFQPVTQLDISATAIRQLIAQNRNPQFLLPDTVLAYINKHNLYKII